MTFTRTGAHSTKKVSIDAPPNTETRVDLAFVPQVLVRGRVARGNTPLAGVMVNFTATALRRARTRSKSRRRAGSRKQIAVSVVEGQTISVPID